MPSKDCKQFKKPTTLSECVTKVIVEKENLSTFPANQIIKACKDAEIQQK